MRYGVLLCDDVKFFEALQLFIQVSHLLRVTEGVGVVMMRQDRLIPVREGRHKKSHVHLHLGKEYSGDKGRDNVEIAILFILQ